MSAENKGRVGVIGLGSMGSAVAANLVKAGFETIGTDISSEARDRFARAGGKPVMTAEEVGKACRHIILLLPTENALYEVCGALAASCAKGAIVMESGTLPLDAKQKMFKLLAAKSVVLLDSPLAGTGAQAQNRDLAVFASGDPNAIQELRPVIDAFSRSCYNLGEFGNGIKMKLVSNLLVAVHNVVAAEAILLGVRTGLDPVNLVKVVSDGSGASRMFQVRGPMMAKRTWVEENTASVKMFYKDVNLINDALRAAGCPAPTFSACLPIYTAAMSSGHAHHDTGSVYEVLERLTLDPAAKDKPKGPGA